MRASFMTVLNVVIVNRPVNTTYVSPGTSYAGVRNINSVMAVGNSAFSCNYGYTFSATCVVSCRMTMISSLQ
jgi:hypothetical protein